MLRFMRNALLVIMAILSLASPHYAQQRSTIFGRTFAGEVVSSNETTREITITYTDKDNNKTETFVGVLKPGYQQRLRDGTMRELQMSEIKPGVRVKVLYQEKSENVAGRKVKFSQIIDIIFLGVFVKYIVALASGQRVSVHNPSAALRRSLSLNQKIRVGWAAGDHRVVEG